MDPTNLMRVGAISKIESIFEGFADCGLRNNAELFIDLHRRGIGGQRLDSNAQSVVPPVNISTHRISFPGKTPREAWKFKTQAVVVRILELMHEALTTNSVVTKRYLKKAPDIYYKDPELFEKQSIVDHYVDDIAYTFGLNRDSLNVVAAAKGLAAGAITLTRTNGSTMDFSTEAEGALVPSQREVQHIDLSDAHWLLMVEKEATFRSLAAGKAWDHPIIGKGVIVTAKGYPDIATRSFLRLLSTAACATGNPPPLYALVDYDPDGIAILSTYKYGSIALAHENASLIAPTMQWIGVQSSDLLPHNAEAASNENSNKSQQLRPLTARDRRLARKLLEKEIYAEDGPELEWRREVQVMLILGVKAEIQIMSGGGRDAALKEWLERKITATSLTEFWRLASERA